MNTYKFYYINLDKSKVRRNFIENQFKEYGVPITRFPAIYGKNLPSSFLKKAKKQFNILAHYPNLNDGEIGLTKTYFELWKVVANQEEDFSIILEDDALLSKSFFDDLLQILNEITTHDFSDISGRKGFLKIDEKEFNSLYAIPSLQTTAQIIGKQAALKLSKNLIQFYAPIDVLKQDVFRHKVKVYTTNKCYVSSNDKNLGGTTLQQKKMPKFKKIVREIIRPLWQFVTLFSYKFYRLTRNYFSYKSINLL